MSDKKFVNEGMIYKAIDNTNVGITISNPRLTGNPLIYVNRGFEITTGYSKEEVLGNNCNFLQGEGTDPLIVEEIRRSIRNKEKIEVEILNYTKNGEPFWNELTISPIFNEEGQLEYFSGIQKDVTQKKNAEDALVLYKKLIELTLQGVLITDDQVNITFVNEAFTRITGYRMDEVLGKNPSILSSGKHDRLFYEEMWTQLNLTNHWQGEIWNKRKNSEIFPELLNISTVRDNHNQVTNYVAIFSDITGLKNIELQLKKANHELEKLASLDGLTGILNRRKFDEYMDIEWPKHQSSSNWLSLILLDVDFFKNYNDTYGHQMGDDALRTVAAGISEVLIHTDSYIARYGGEEFAVIMPLTPPAEAHKMAESIRKNIKNKKIPHRSSDIENVLTTSIGVATLIPNKTASIKELIHLADEALYEAKREGRNRVSTRSAKNIN